MEIESAAGIRTWGNPTEMGWVSTSWTNTKNGCGARMRVPTHAFVNTCIFKQPQITTLTNRLMKEISSPKERSKHTYNSIQVITISGKFTHVILASTFTANLLAGDLWSVWIPWQTSLKCSTNTKTQPKSRNYTSISDCEAPAFTFQPLMRTFYLSEPVCSNSLRCSYHLVIWQYQHDSQVMCLYANQILMKQASCRLQS